MTRINSKHSTALYKVGVRTKVERPTKAVRERRTPEIDADALAAAKDRLNELAQTPAAVTGTSNRLPATGTCHSCERPVSGERRYCGPCLARRI